MAVQKHYKYKVEGTDAEGNGWTCEGVFSNSTMNVTIPMQLTFQQLTDGRAVFGEPGKGCKGPYNIHKFNVELRE